MDTKSKIDKYLNEAYEKDIDSLYKSTTQLSKFFRKMKKEKMIDNKEYIKISEYIDYILMVLGDIEGE